MRVTQHSADHVSGTSAEIAQRQIIRDNIATWRRERSRRHTVIEKRTFVRHFNSINDAMIGKRVIT